MEMREQGCHPVLADIFEKDALVTAMKGATAVQVIIPTSRDGADVSGLMRSEIAAVVTALKAARPKAIVAISDYGANLDFDTGITSIFWEFERDLKSLDIPLTLVRSAEHMENWGRVARQGVTTGTLPSMLGPADRRFPMVSAGDVGTATVDYLLTGGQATPLRVVHVEGPGRYSPNDVASILKKIANGLVEVKVLSPQERLEVLTAGGLGISFASLLAGMYDASNAGHIEVEAGVGETRFGTTTLKEVLRRLLQVG
jgi:uncharacterized protein YbjT (DUF2867 family)